MMLILQDIEQDIEELNYLVKMVSAEPENVGLCKIACRRIDGVKNSLSLLQAAMEYQPERTNGQAVAIGQIVPQQIEVVVEEPVFANAVEEKEVFVGIPTAEVLGERLRAAGELRDQLTLNDVFRFSRELFDGDSEQMNLVLKKVSRMASLEEANAFMVSGNIDMESEAYPDWMDVLERYFAK